jgi:hypothetical protein
VSSIKKKLIKSCLSVEEVLERGVNLLMWLTVFREAILLSLWPCISRGQSPLRPNPSQIPAPKKHLGGLHYTHRALSISCLWQLEQSLHDSREQKEPLG